MVVVFFKRVLWIRLIIDKFIGAAVIIFVSCWVVIEVVVRNFFILVVGEIFFLGVGSFGGECFCFWENCFLIDKLNKNIGICVLLVFDIIWY